MTEKEFVKKRFRAFEVMEFANDRMKNIDGGNGVVAECMLLAVDFDLRMFKLVPFENVGYEEKEFWVHCQFVNRPRPKPKLAQ